MSKSASKMSSLAKKYWMGATGLFLCLFLIGHLGGNLQLVMFSGEEGRLQFNQYTHFMTTNIMVITLSWITYLSIIFHSIDGALLTRHNRKARPQKYAYSRPDRNTRWSSRNMGILGTVILVFIILHMSNFWWIVKYGDIPMQTVGVDGEPLVRPLKDLYTVVMSFFNPNENSFALVWVIFYVLSQVAVTFHLIHGFNSGFQSLGVRHPKYTPFLKKFGYAFAVIIPAGFAAITVYLYVIQM